MKHLSILSQKKQTEAVRRGDGLGLGGSVSVTKMWGLISHTVGKA